MYCSKDGISIYGYKNSYVTDNAHLLNKCMEAGFETTSGFSKWNGKVIGEFICDKIYHYSTCNVEGVDISDEDITKYSCLSKDEIGAYEMSSEPKENCVYRVGVYGWRISNVAIYDSPKDLLDFGLKRPPQSWCYL